MRQVGVQACTESEREYMAEIINQAAEELHINAAGKPLEEIAAMCMRIKLKRWKGHNGWVRMISRGDVTDRTRDARVTSAVTCVCRRLPLLKSHSLSSLASHLVLSLMSGTSFDVSALSTTLPGGGWWAQTHQLPASTPHMPAWMRYPPPSPPSLIPVPLRMAPSAPSGCSACAPQPPEILWWSVPCVLQVK